MPHNPYHYEKPRNWPKIILITMAVLIVIIGGILGVKTYLDKRDDVELGPSMNEGIAVGEPNPNGYDCTRDVYNCGNFTTQSEAQVAFDSCFDTAGDVWRLDSDGDGMVCEGL